MIDKISNWNFNGKTTFKYFKEYLKYFKVAGFYLEYWLWVILVVLGGDYSVGDF